MPIFSLPERDTQPDNTRMPLIRWIWRAYFRSSLIPLIIVEVALITIYFVSNAFSTRENTDTVRQLAEQNLTQLAQREAKNIDRQMEGVAQATDFLRRMTHAVMVDGISPQRDDPSRFAYADYGAYYTTRDTGGSAVFYSGAVPIGAAEREKAMRSAGLDPAFKDIKHSFPLIVQIYYNTHDSLNRIYPYFDVLPQYPAKMDIPKYNFYYEADATHNPKRKVVWTDVYVDPAGQGWMTSCIAPVYRGDFLEGVLGSDVTIGTIISDVLNLQIPWEGYGLLISREGTIMALPKAGEADWGLQEMTRHEYKSAIQQDTFKPDAFKIDARAGNRELAEDIRSNAAGMRHTVLGDKRIVSWATIPQTGWKLLVVAPEHNIYAPAQTLADRLNHIAWLMVGGMLAFYVIFFFLLFHRARQMSQFVAQPLQQIDSMVQRVAAGEYLQPAPDLQVSELHETALGVVQMGEKLHAADQSRVKAELELAERSRQLQLVFDLSPDGYVTLDADGSVVRVNPAFLRITQSPATEWLGLDELGLWQHLRTYGGQEAWQAQRQPHTLRLELTRPKRTILQCEIVALEGHDARLEGKFIYFRDMTHTEELDRMKSTFLATAAHELRTPLTSVLGYSELLLHGRLPQDARDEALQSIHVQSRWLVTMINELLDLARIESRAGLDFNIVPESLRQVIHGVLDNLSVPEGRQPVHVETLEDSQVLIDSAKFRQVLLNVIDNAYKYSPGDNRVALGTCLDNSRHPGEMGVWVRDHGIGLAPEQVARVFDRFWRADNSGSLPGTGLGMSISKEIMQVLDGSIDIRSAPGEGTTVTLWVRQSTS